MVEADGERHSPPSLGQSSAMADLFVLAVCCGVVLGGISERADLYLCVGSLLAWLAVWEKLAPPIGQEHNRILFTSRPVTILI